MGCFDSVWFDCPACGEKSNIEFQSKAGDCALAGYNSNEVPPEIANDISGDRSVCGKCRKWFEAVLLTKITGIPMMVKPVQD